MSTTKTITVVTGIARSGTSLMMRIVRACGLTVLADSEDGGLEYGKTCGLPRKSAWLDLAEGKAVKILDMHVFTPPLGRDYRFIFMRRDHVEQAKSTVKFLRGLNVIPRNAPINMQEMVSGIRRDTETALGIAKARGPVLEIHFEELVQYPVSGCQWVIDFLRAGVSVESVFGLVKRRDPACAPGLDMELSMMNGGAS